MLMMRRTPISRKASGSSRSLSVSMTNNRYRVVCISDCTAELELDEEGTRISLTIVDTPGFGDQIDNEARLAQHVIAAKPQLTVS